MSSAEQFSSSIEPTFLNPSASFGITLHYDATKSTESTRIRRVKCDESKPSCSRCADTGRLCDFLRPAQQFLTSLLSRKPRKLEHSSKLSKTNLQLLPKPSYSLSSQLPIHEVDHLEYFHLLCTKSFSGYFGNFLWNRQCFKYPTLRSLYGMPSFHSQHFFGNRAAHHGR